ncbi:MAG: hypothetical protein HY232_17350, partial [Acidobacteria bacterium]|nr:hypothetical protein [Acidobacteriota bacterium]
GMRYVTNTTPDGTYTLSTLRYGRLISTAAINPSLGQLGLANSGYDAHNRQNTSTDARNGTTTFTFNNADQIVSTTTPKPDTINSAQVTVSGRIKLTHLGSLQTDPPLAVVF